MDFLPDEIESYSENYTSPEPELLYELNRYTHTNVLQPRMLAGHLQGRVLAMFSKMIAPKTVVEVGTYTGYSALCLAEGLAKNGIVHTIEVNDELEPKIRSYFDRSPFSQQIKLHIGDARAILGGIPGPVDIAYLDADKTNYSNYFDMLIDKVRAGGFIIADNVLWSGKVTGRVDAMDEDTRALHEYAAKVRSDPRVENVLMPLRDGLMISRKL